MQQALTNLYEHRHRYDWRDPGGLLRRSVVNECCCILRRPRMGTVGEEHAGRPDSPLGTLVDRETVAEVRAAIDRLPENFRAALVLCEYENMAYTQIAEELGASIPQVKTWIHRARRQLRRCWERPGRKMWPTKLENNRELNIMLSEQDEELLEAYLDDALSADEVDASPGD